MWPPELSRELLGTIPGWITSGGVMTGLFLLMRHGIQWRGQSLTAEQQIRDHYAKEVQALRDALRMMEKHYREMLAASDKRHGECEEDRNNLRDRVRELEKHVDGLERKILALGDNRMLELLPDKAPEAVESAPRAISHRVDK